MTVYSSAKHIKAVTAFLLVLVLFLVITDMLIINNQRRIILKEITDHLNNNIIQTGLLLREPLLRHDYDYVEQSIINWGEENDDILEIKAVMPNGFLLAHYMSANSKINVHTITKQINFFNRNLITLEVILDHASADKILNRLKIQLIIASLLLSSLFAVVLWTVMLKIAIGPLEKEIDRRRLAEENLLEVKDGLQDEVAKRTEELSAKYNELQKINKAFVGRELKMAELKKEIEELKK